VERFINGYQSRNERLADFIAIQKSFGRLEAGPTVEPASSRRGKTFLDKYMRRMRICEEKSSGIDKVIHAVELYQLPEPNFRVGHRRTIVILFGPRDFETMDREDRVRACYQHAALKWVMSERMTNQSLRNRFHLPERKSAIVSQVIAFSIEAGVIKPDEAKGISQHG